MAKLEIARAVSEKLNITHRQLILAALIERFCDGVNQRYKSSTRLLAVHSGAFCEAELTLSTQNDTKAAVLVRKGIIGVVSYCPRSSTYTLKVCD